MASCCWLVAFWRLPAGMVPQHIQEKVLLRIKYYRMMCGILSDLTMDTAQSRKCQEAALMSSANGSLSHNPPSTWTCFTVGGAEACARSNLSLGNHKGSSSLTPAIENIP